MKALKSKTIISAILLGVLGAVQSIIDGGIIQSPEVVGYIAMGVAVVQMILRALTSKALSDK